LLCASSPIHRAGSGATAQDIIGATNGAMFGQKDGAARTGQAADRLSLEERPLSPDYAPHATRRYPSKPLDGSKWRPGGVSPGGAAGHAAGLIETLASRTLTLPASRHGRHRVDVPSITQHRLGEGRSSWYGFSPAADLREGARPGFARSACNSWACPLDARRLATSVDWTSTMVIRCTDVRRSSEVTWTSPGLLLEETGQRRYYNQDK
jgi:hypothetical protein